LERKLEKTIKRDTTESPFAGVPATLAMEMKHDIS
jgi:hypothetical protein